MGNQIRKGWNTGFFTSPDAIFDTDVSLHGKMVYLYLCRCADSQAQSFPSLADICKKTGMKKTKCCESLNELEQRGLLTREARYKGNSKERTSNLYTLFHPHDPYVVDDEGSSLHEQRCSQDDIHVVRHTDNPISRHEQEGQQIKDYTTNKDYTNNKQDDTVVAVVREQIESHLGTSIASLSKVLPDWVSKYGADKLLDVARYIGSTPQKWDKSIVGAYRTAVTEDWDIPAGSGYLDEPVRDERYGNFYELFPEA